WLARLPRSKWLESVALALILGGALGNLYDRIVHGHVVDFILVHWHQSWYFPAFNIADSAITVGAVMLIADMFRPNRAEGGACAAEASIRLGRVWCGLACGNEAWLGNVGAPPPARRP